MDVGSMIIRMRRLIREEVAAVEHMLASDKCSSMEEYKKLVGIVAGLDRADAIIVECASKAAHSEENF